MSIPVPSLPVHVPPQRLALAAFLSLLIAATALRFYDLPGHDLWYDEAVASNNSSGALSEVVPNTRQRNSSPILYPLALWAVQKVDVSAFSVRVLPATASVLTVAVMLFLLPRLGIARGAAFLAALLTTLSVAAIYHAQDAREYSIDALLAVLMIAGLLWYLRDGRKDLLCVSLFLAPLLQYGLVLFGAAVIAAAMLLPSPQTLAAAEGNTYPGRVRNWIEQRSALLWPAACFLAGCAISYAVTLRYQWGRWGWGADSYQTNRYQGGFDAPSIFEFSFDGTWRLLTYHLPEVVAVLAVGAFALMLMASLKRRRLDAIATLALLAVGIAIFAALLTIYPLGAIRQNLYLGPIIFLAAGVSIYWMAESLAPLTRRAWMAPALAAAAAGAIALAGVSALSQDSPYKSGQNAKSVIAFLEKNVEEGDMVYVATYAIPPIKFYQDEKPSNYYYAEAGCWDAFEECIQEMLQLALSRHGVTNRIFMVHNYESIGEELDLLEEQVSVKRFLADGEWNISLIANVKEFVEPAYRTFVSVYEAVVPGEPAIRSTFDVYLRDNTLTYVKDQCTPADTEPTFFLHLYPVDVNDLPDPRKKHGFDNLDFDFDQRGATFDGKCIANIPLPEYDIATISAGQYVPVEGGYKHLWEGEIRLDE